MKPLFLAVRSESFDKFKTGEKTTEYRLCDRQWNERTCRKGRPIVLSTWGAKTNPINGKVVKAKTIFYEDLPWDEYSYFLDSMATVSFYESAFIAIEIEIDK